MSLFGGRKRRQEAWIKAAKDLGGAYQPTTKWYRADEKITATLHGVPIVLDVYVVSTGKSSQAYTRITAQYAHGPGPKLNVYKQGWFARAAKAFGMNDFALGDAEFDAAFIARGNSPAVARRLWTPPAMALMAGPLKKTQVTSDENQVVVIEAGRWEDPAKIVAGFELIGLLASRDLYGLASLLAIEGATIRHESGERPRAELDTGMRVIVQAEDHDERLVMAARAAEQLDVEPAVIEIVDGKLAGDRVLPQAMHVHASTVGSGTLTIERAWCYFIWRDLELDAKRLRAGADLIGAVAASARGVYR